MIQEFRVRNFMSIKEEQILSFEATKDLTSREYLTYQVKPTVSLLKMVILYGANASGKSNVLLALQNMWELLCNPATKKDEKINYEPFALNQEEPTSFSCIFYIDTVKYEYSVSFNNRFVLKEKMEYAPNGVLSLFYQREFVGEDCVPSIEFGRLLNLSAKTKNAIISNTLNNHTVLSTYAKISVEVPAIRLVHDWIVTNVHEIEGESVMDVAESVLENEEKRNFFLKYLSKADFNISNIQIEEKEMPEEIKTEILNTKALPEDVKKRLLAEKNEDVVFTHRTNSGVFSLSGRLQSLGTLRYFIFLERLYNMTKGNHIYLYDEFERGMHYDLFVYYLSFFMMHTQASQMILATHDQMLLDEEFIRRDMVWFTEKSKETGATELYSATDFGLHKNVSLYNAYKIGKLGAKPQLGSIF